MSPGVGLRTLESHTCQALKPRRTWYSGRHGGLAAIINSFVTAVLVSWPPSKFPGTRLALDVLALPQLACFPACHFRLARVQPQPPPPQNGTYLLPARTFFCTLGGEGAVHTFSWCAPAGSKIDLSVRTCQNIFPQSPKQPQPREVQPPTSSTTALPNFATTTSPSHQPQSWRPLTCPAFSTPPARTLSCSWPPRPTSAPRTCRFT